MRTSVMKSLRFAAFGWPSVLRIDEVPIPSPAKAKTGSNEGRSHQPKRHRGRLGNAVAQTELVEYGAGGGSRRSVSRRVRLARICDPMRSPAGAVIDTRTEDLEKWVLELTNEARTQFRLAGWTERNFRRWRSD